MNIKSDQILISGEIRIEVPCFMIVGDEPPKPIIVGVIYNPMRRKPPECWLRRIERAA